MVFEDSELEKLINVSNAKPKTNEPQLEKYGVWVKKGPSDLLNHVDSTEPTINPEKDSFLDSNTTLSTDELLNITNNIIPEEQIDPEKDEQIDSFDEEMNSLLDTDDDNSENQEITKPEQTVVEAKPQETKDTPMSDDDFDVDALMANIPDMNDASSSTTTDEVNLDDFLSTDSSTGEESIDLDAFMSGSESINLDDFMGESSHEEKKQEIIDEEPINMDLQFDDNYVLETKPDPVSQVEFVGMNDDGNIEGVADFDSMFDNIEDESSPKATSTQDEVPMDFFDDTPTPTIPKEETVVQSKSELTTEYDTASEFDDLLSSLDEASPQTDTPEEAKTKAISKDYNISVTMDNEDDTPEEDEDTTEDNAELDDISLFQSSADIEIFKELEKKDNTPYSGGMKVLEAQSDMDFDEIDKILDGEEITFPDEDKKTTEKNDTPEFTDDLAFSNTEIKAQDENNIDDLESIELEDLPLETIKESEEEPTTEELPSDDSFLDDLNTETVDFDPDVIDEFEASPSQEETDSKDNLKDILDEDVTNDDLADDTVSDDLSDITDENPIEEQEMTLDIQEPSVDSIEDDLSETIESSNVVPEDLVDGFDNDDLSDIDSELPDFDIIEDKSSVSENNSTLSVPSNDNNGNEILKKISDEISFLRNEITTLRNEFDSLKGTPKQDIISSESINDVELPPKEDKESTGFFNDDIEDETIALSGDELNNILNNADFTNDETDFDLDSSDNLDSDIPTSLDDSITATDNAVEDIDDSVDTMDSIEEPEDEKAEEVPFNPLGETTDLSDNDIDTLNEYDDSDFVDDTTSEFANEQLTEPVLDNLDIGTSFTEPEVSNEIDVPKVDDIIVESADNDFIESIDATEPSITDTLTEDRLKYLEDEPKTVAEVPSSIPEENDVVTDKTETDISNENDSSDDFDEEAEQNEPTDKVFDSTQWDNTIVNNDSVETVESNDSSFEQPETDLQEEEPTTSDPVIEKPIDGINTNIQTEIKSVLLYMDQLLENLPEDKIEEFARSEHFDTYKKLFTELGLTK